MSDRTLLVLAGGFGTRLRSVVADVPKPLAPAGDEPFLRHLVARWVEQHVERFILLAHHHADQIDGFVRAEMRAGLFGGRAVEISVEPRPLGTGGAVAFAVQRFGLRGSFLVANADTWLSSGIDDVAATPAPALAAVRVDDVSRYGALRLDDGRVMAFVEKEQSRGPGWINAGLYHLPAALFESWNGDPFSLERDIFPDLARKGHLAAVPLESEFIDIGIPDDYHRFRQWTESGKTGVL